MGCFRKITPKKGQSSIEVAIVLGVMAILTLSLARSWVWTNKNMVDRIQDYKNTRLDAGRQGNPGQWSPTPKKELKIFK